MLSLELLVDISLMIVHVKYLFMCLLGILKFFFGEIVIHMFLFILKIEHLLQALFF